MVPHERTKGGFETARKTITLIPVWYVAKIHSQNLTKQCLYGHFGRNCGGFLHLNNLDCRHQNKKNPRDIDSSDYKITEHHILGEPE